MSNESDLELDIVQEQESVLAQERQKAEERRRQERRGWYITWTASSAIVLVTVLIAIALGGNDPSGNLAAGGESYRVVTSFTFTSKEGSFGSNTTIYIDGSTSTRRVVVETPAAGGGGPSNLEFVVSDTDVYLKLTEGGIPRPESVPLDKEWLLLSEDNALIQGLNQSNETAGILNGGDIDPFGYLDSLTIEKTVKELRKEDLRGTPTTVSRITVDTKEYFEAQGQAEIGEQVLAQVGKKFTFDVWIDDDGNLQRWQFSDTIQGTTVVILSEFFLDETILIEIPQSGIVYDMRQAQASPSPSPSA